MKIGDKITLIPTQGCYQEPCEGVIEKITPKQIVVSSRETFKGRYWRSNGYPIGYNAKEFPVYVVCKEDLELCPAPNSPAS